MPMLTLMLELINANANKYARETAKVFAIAN